MRRSRLVAGVLAAAGAAALAARGRREARERVSLHYEDGTVLTLAGGTPEAERVLDAARAALVSSR